MDIKTLKIQRLLKDLTQAELAEKAGIPQSHLSNIESGKMFPSKLTMKKIESALGAKVDWVATRLQGRIDFAPDGESAGEDHVMSKIFSFIQSAQAKDRKDKFKFLHDFLNQFEKLLEEKQKLQNQKLKKKKGR
jgi:transcriptional regulator with XRE-family HTH domain